MAGRVQAQAFECAWAGGAPRSGLQDVHRGKIGRVLTLEIDAAGEAGGAGGARIGAAGLTQAPGKIGRTFPYCHPGLMIAGTGSQNQESDSPHTLEPGAAEVVELDQLGRGAPGSHDDIVLARDSRLE